MDSVPLAPERRHIGVATVFAALVLLAFVGVMVWLHHGASRVEEVAEPERALAAVVGRTLDLDDGLARAPAWERRLYALLVGSRAEDLAQAIVWYDELEALSPDPGVDLCLAILEGEAGRLDRLRRRVRAWELRERPLPALAGLVRAAYLDGAADPGPAARAMLNAALGPGWFRDRLVLAPTARAGCSGGCVPSPSRRRRSSRRAWSRSPGSSGGAEPGRAPARRRFRRRGAAVTGPWSSSAAARSAPCS